jgi:hypothetical protein
MIMESGPLSGQPGQQPDFVRVVAAELEVKALGRMEPDQVAPQIWPASGMPHDPGQASGTDSRCHARRRGRSHIHIFSDLFYRNLIGA